MDYGIPKETTEWLKSIEAYKFEKPIIYSVRVKGVTMHYSADYLKNTPLEELKARYERDLGMAGI